ncbi:hypothetical protein [Candidatus Uabimicrobium sp. HlEnr_7]|uniref:hypothetical protein n=1 Tax=Candidatus Uabimicrobium helgolandensis TaxID=3095367 RepID=UPI003555E7C3
MTTIDRLQNEITITITYCGLQLAGKKTNLQNIHGRTPKTGASLSKLISTNEGGCEIRYFEHTPLAPRIDGMRVRLRLLAICGKVNNAAKNVLQKTDAIIFVADSSREKLNENLIALHNLEKYLYECNIDILDVLTIQWNKQDATNICESNVLDQHINYLGFPSSEAIALNGEGVFASLKMCCVHIFPQIEDKIKSRKTDLYKECYKKSLTTINSNVSYNGCVFYLEKNTTHSFEQCTFHNCSFRSNGVYINLVNACKFSNCGFWGEFTIDLSDKKLRSIPHWVYSATFISKLFLQKNQISSVLCRLGKLKRLHHLCLDDNEITFLPDSIKLLQNLVFLGLSRHKLCKNKQASLKLSLPKCEIKFE